MFVSQHTKRQVLYLNALENNIDHRCLCYTISRFMLRAPSKGATFLDSTFLLPKSGFKQFVCPSTKGHRCWLLFYSHNLSLSTYIGAVWRKSISISFVLFRFKNTICARDTNYVLGPITKIQQKQPWQYNTTTLQNVIKRQKFETSNNKTLRVNSHVIEKTLFYLS